MRRGRIGFWMRKECERFELEDVSARFTGRGAGSVLVLLFSLRAAREVLRFLAPDFGYDCFRGVVRVLYPYALIYRFSHFFGMTRISFPITLSCPSSAVSVIFSFVSNIAGTVALI